MRLKAGKNAGIVTGAQSRVECRDVEGDLPRGIHGGVETAD